MKLEHHSEKLLPFKNFLIRLLKYMLVAVILIGFSVGLGTAGYHYAANLAWIDSFYNACMILTGMGPVSILNSNVAKLFSSFYALYSGIVFLGITAIFLAPVAHRVLHILHADSQEPKNLHD